METRVCKKCLKERQIEDFYRLDKNGVKHWRRSCKDCVRVENNIREHKRYENKKDEILAKHREKNKTPQQKNRRREYLLNNANKVSTTRKKYYLENREEELTYSQNYRKENPEKVRESQNKSINKRRSDPVVRLRHNVSALIRNAINKNNKSFTNYFTYTIKELKEHLEKQFEPWMNWENQGIYAKNSWDDNDKSTWVWQIDHINSSK